MTEEMILCRKKVNLTKKYFEKGGKKKIIMPNWDDESPPKVYKPTDIINCKNPRAKLFQELSYALEKWHLREKVLLRGDASFCVECNFACDCEGWKKCDRCRHAKICKITCNCKVLKERGD
jgi:hypothetical protein